MRFTITENGTQGPYRLEGRVARPVWGLVAGGVWGGATVAVEMALSADGPFTATPEGTLTGPTALTSDMPDKCYVQVVTTDATGTTDVTLEIG